MKIGDLVRETLRAIPSYQKGPYYAIVIALHGERVDIVWLDTMEPDNSDISHLEVISENR